MLADARSRRYCKRVYDSDESMRSTIFLLLLRIYLRPRPSHPLLFAPALSLLSTQAARIDPTEVFDLLPPLVALGDLQVYLEKTLRRSTERVREAKMVKAIGRSWLDQNEREVVDLEERRVKVTEGRVCAEVYRCLHLFFADSDAHTAAQCVTSGSGTASSRFTTLSALPLPLSWSSEDKLTCAFRSQRRRDALPVSRAVSGGACVAFRCPLRDALQGDPLSRPRLCPRSRGLVFCARLALARFAQCAVCRPLASRVSASGAGLSVASQCVASPSSRLDCPAADSLARPQPGRCVIDTLSHELLCRIFEEAELKLDQVCLSRSLLSAALEALYDNVQIYSKRMLGRFCASLRARPELAGCVKAFGLSGRDDDDDDEWEEEPSDSALGEVTGSMAVLQLDEDSSGKLVRVVGWLDIAH